MNRGGLCDVCISPGACCRKVYLSGGPKDDPTRQIDAPMSFERAEHLALGYGLPFRPSEQLPDGRWSWSCTALGGDGRCTIYETRPQLCRLYAPGQDRLCVHFVPRSEEVE